MTPFGKIVIGGILVALTCTAVIVPTVMVVTKSKDSGNTTTTGVTTVASTSRTGNASTNMGSGGSTSSPGSTTSIGSTSSTMSTSSIAVTSSGGSTVSTSSTASTSSRGSTSTLGSTSSTASTPSGGSTVSTTSTASTSSRGSTSTLGSTSSGGSTSSVVGSTSALGSTSSMGSTSVTGSTAASTSTTRITNTTVSITIATTSSSTFSTTISASLTTQSGTVCISSGCTAGANFYQAFLLNITISGSYVIYSQSSLDTFGLLYSPSFDPRYPSINLLVYDDDSNSNSQYRLTTPQLTANVVYILVSTTYAENTQGTFSVVATGPGPIILRPINISNPASAVVFRRNISISLTSNSSRFCRLPTCSSPDYYYQTIVFNVSNSGIYSIQSLGNAIDTFGFLYATNFIPSNITQNLIAADDDGAGDAQFLLAGSLSVGIRYIAVATTYYASTFGPIFVGISGPGNTTLIA